MLLSKIYAHHHMLFHIYLLSRSKFFRREYLSLRKSLWFQMLNLGEGLLLQKSHHHNILIRPEPNGRSSFYHYLNIHTIFSKIYSHHVFLMAYGSLGRCSSAVLLLMLFVLTFSFL